MVEALSKHMNVIGTDIVRGVDFLETTTTPGACDAIITNPEFKIARQVIEHATELMKPCRGFVAMLLPANFDHAKTRQHLFGQCKIFYKKVALTRRIVFFDRPGAAPSEWHMWAIWDWAHNGPPATLAYAPASEDVAAAHSLAEAA
jgi:hypothetical protein